MLEPNFEEADGLGIRQKMTSSALLGLALSIPNHARKNLHHMLANFQQATTWPICLPQEPRPIPSG